MAYLSCKTWGAIFFLIYYYAKKKKSYDDIEQNSSKWCLHKFINFLTHDKKIKKSFHQKEQTILEDQLKQF